MSQQKNEIEIIESTATNYCVYPGQCQAQRAYIYICPEQNHIYSDYSSDTGASCSMAIFHDREKRWAIPATLRVDEINHVMSVLKQTAQRVVNGYESVYDSRSNMVGAYDDDATAALDELDTYFENYQTDEHIAVYDDVAEYLEYTTIINFLTETDVTTFDALLDKIKAEMEDDDEISFGEADIVEHIVDEIENDNLSIFDLPQWCLDDNDDIKKIVKTEKIELAKDLIERLTDRIEIEIEPEPEIDFFKRDGTLYNVLHLYSRSI